jgi:anaerobic selenocysteine-containing dehydrogenase
MTATEFKKSACILCSINCGLDIQTGGKDGRELLKIKGDKDCVHSEGYLCNKAARLNHYQSGADRLQSPMRRKPDGTYEAVSWDVAISEVAAGLQKVRKEHGSEKLLFIGGGGQGNHLGGVYANALNRFLGLKYQTNALAQEKTGEFWVLGKMFGGAPAHGDFHHAEVAVFLGKNPWQAHGFPQTRKVMRDIAKDPERTMIVIDPSLTDSAKMADIHLRLRPGTDAWMMSALTAIILEEGLENKEFIKNHTEGFDKIETHFRTIDIAEYARICDVDEDLLRQAARRIATAKSMSLFEDLGIQQNVHSTIVSYLQRIMWVICGHFAKEGAHNISVPFLLITNETKSSVGAEKKNAGQKKKGRVSPVLGRRVIAGMLPCNEIPDEILTDHPDRFRAAIIQSSNPVHSYANIARMREAIRALEFSVVIDVAMTETAREASYVLPACGIFEKHECTFFSVEFPKNFFHLRHPIVDPLPGTLTEAEIHTRLIEEMGGLKKSTLALLRLAAKLGNRAFAAAFGALVAANKDLMKIAPAVLYRSGCSISLLL